MKKSFKILFIVLGIICVIAAAALVFTNTELSDSVMPQPSFGLVNEEFIEPTPAPTPEPTPEPTPKPTPEPQKGTFGEIWGKIFAKEGEEYIGDNYYRNENVYITVQVHHEENLTYTVADIYIRDITNLKTGFAHDKYKGRSEDFMEQVFRADAILAVTGDFYSHESSGLVIRNGEVFRDELSSWDVCVLYKDGTLETYSPKEAKENLDTIIASEPWQSWCFGPILLKDGQPLTKEEDGFNSSVWPKNPRNAIGYYEPGHYCFVSVDGRQGEYSQGMNLDELSQLMYSLGCTEAYNLDGGATAAMAWQGEIYNSPSGGGRPIPDIIYIDQDAEL